MNRLKQPPQKQKMLAAYSPSHDHELSSHPPELKICQWYCCDCGQTHGQILYTDAPSDVPSKTDYIGKVKYYSRVVYDKSHNNHENYDCHEGASPNDTNTLPLNATHMHTHTHTHDADTLHLHDLPPLSPAGDSDNESLDSPPLPLTYLLHIDKDYLGVQKQKVVLDPPSRFTCRRCNHMMCPYCLKIRLRDLK